MKKLEKTTPKMLNTSLKYLVVAIASIATIPIAQSDVANKGIGDLEIYKPAEGGKVTITMMLDTSGSMVADQTDPSACDFPNGENFVTIKTEKSKTTPSYDRTICTATGFKQYTYAEIRPTNGRSVWYSCNNPGGTICTQLGGPINQPNLTGHTAELASRSLSLAGTTGAYYRYYKVARPLATPLTNTDRLTRLKDALFTLLDKDEKGNYLLDSSKVAIGIGQFSTQSGANNVTGVPDGTTGKILVPARPLTEAQRDELKVVAAQLIGGGGTPSAAAYAEAGAYMLGTTTNTTSNKILREKYRVVVGRDASRTYYACTAHSPSSGVWCSASGWTLLARRPTEWDDNKTQRCRNTSDTCFSEEISDTTVNKGLSGFANSATSTKNGNNYISPIDTASGSASCDGQGIYFLTDGEPNSSQQPELLMTTALGSKASSFVYDPRSTNNAGALPAGLQVFHGTPQVGLFAKSLRESDKNPKGTSIRTAVVGFGSIFDISKYANAERTLNTPELDKLNSLPVAGKFKEGSSTKYIDCSKILAVDARNACNWGAKSHPELPNVGGFGEGGFYSAQSTNDVIKSVTTFLGDLSQTIEPVPAGVIVVPDDPYTLGTKQAVAYYPTVQADVEGTPAVWAGNMKKYSLYDGTLYGKANIKLFKNQAGDLEPTAQDLWSDKDYSGKNNEVSAGGFYAQLKTPKSGVGTTRKLYIQDAGQLKTFGVNAQGKVTVNGTAMTATSLTDSIYTEDVKKRLLNFLGFNDLPTGTVQSMTLTAPADDVKVLGASIHSAPAVVSHGADLDGNGRVTADRSKDYVLFGSMDGALHLVKAGDYGTNGGGQEEFAFIPQTMLTGQNLQGLSKSGTGKAVGVPNFGIDAPWLVATDYKYDLTNKKVSVDNETGIGMYTYGGLRMGGEAFYGLDLANINEPKLAFAITPTSISTPTEPNKSTRDFSRLGQIWVKPVRATIKEKSTDTKGTEVLIFGGGYDMCYENQNFQVGVTDSTLGDCSGKESAKGNAIYIINAKTGALIWSASSASNATTTNADMKHSIVGEVTVLDRDNDGLMDHIYYADLGGQVFRADFKNAGATGDFANARIVKLLSSAYTGTEAKYNRRFYEAPVVSVYRNDSTNRLFALINVISGDRSSPLSTLRGDNKYADRVYGLIDSDVSLPSKTFYAAGFTSSFGTGATDDNLINIPTELANNGTIPYSNDTKSKVMNIIKNQTKDSTKINGWYYPLTRFDGYANVKYTKGVGKSVVIGSNLYTTTYNPDMDYNAGANSCSAKIAGGSERQLYCLPYGICSDETSQTGTGGYMRAGRGIQELTLGPRSDRMTNQTVLIGNQTITERAEDQYSVNFGADAGKSQIIENAQKQGGNSDITLIGGDGSAAIYLYNERFQLQPKTWYEIN